MSDDAANHIDKDIREAEKQAFESSIFIARAKLSTIGYTLRDIGAVLFESEAIDLLEMATEIETAAAAIRLQALKLTDASVCLREMAAPRPIFNTPAYLLETK